MKKRIIMITAAVLFLGIGIFVYCRYFRVRYEIVERYGGDITLEQIEWIGIAPDGISTCIVGAQWNYKIILGKYVVIADIEGGERKVYRGNDYLGTEEYYDVFKLYTYDIIAKEQTEICDINELMKQNYPDFELVDYGWVCQWEGQDVYIIKIKEKTNWPNKKYIYISVEDGSYEEHTDRPDRYWDTSECSIFFWKDYSLFEQNLPQELAEEMDIFQYHNYEGVFKVRGLAEYLPEHNEILYSLFPELEQYRGEEDCYIYMFIGGNPSAEELLRLFMEDGQEISFEGAVLSGEQSIDGEDHEINSFEEYEQWRDYNK